ncbi:uncharacterized protein LOC113004037 [Solenopsis invicta]|uniref:uncharacterized protein LOC113004037 n=1 Tax=Solenopsis invicta TaxID=13686 RepID=UPI00193CA883|nr:uncharacterized protein LOC113004037 [Solenopsis invicta]
MIRPVIQYCRLNKILLLIIGLWPYQQSIFTRFQFIFLSFILTASIIFQLTLLVILKCTSNLVLKVLSSVSFYTMFVITYNSFHFNMEDMENLLTELLHVFNNLKDENEIAIFKKYNFIAKCYTFGLTAFGIFSIFIYILIEYWWNIVDTPMNVSVPRHLLIITGDFVEEKYFSVITLYMYTVLCISLIIMLATGTMMLTYLYYICGMFKIASYRIEHAININTLQNITLKSKTLMTQGVIYAVDIHRQAIKFVSTSTIFVQYLYLNLFQIFEIELSGNNINEFCLPFLYATISMIYIFLANYIGQNVFDHNIHVFVTVYNVQWYKAPMHIQKMILFLLRRGTKKFTLNVGGLLDGTIENFATLTKASISYFTVIYSTR